MIKDLLTLSECIQKMIYLRRNPTNSGTKYQLKKGKYLKQLRRKHCILNDARIFVQDSLQSSLDFQRYFPKWSCNLKCIRVQTIRVSFKY